VATIHWKVNHAAGIAPPTSNTSSPTRAFRVECPNYQSISCQLSIANTRLVKMPPCAQRP
jgi:hypothetical protein